MKAIRINDTGLEAVNQSWPNRILALLFGEPCVIRVTGDQGSMIAAGKLWRGVFYVTRYKDRRKVLG